MEGLPFLLEDLRFATAAVAIAAGLGLLRRSRLRNIGLAFWSLFPALLMIPATLVHLGSMTDDSFIFVLLMAILNTVPWATLVLLAFALVRWLKQRSPAARNLP
jgi:hypothetical protein